MLNRSARSVRRARSGMTLIEILIVIAILLAIGGLVVVNLIPAREQANRDLQLNQFDNISGAMDRFRLDLNRYPTEEEGIAALWNREVLETDRDQANWRGPYLQNPIREDYWGNEIIYRYPSEIRDEDEGDYYDLISPGPDGEEGTEDDITNHDRLRDEDGEIGGFDDFQP